MQNFADKFFRCRERIFKEVEDFDGIRQTLADKSGVSLRTINSYRVGKWGKRGPSWVLVEKLAHTLGVNPDWLFGREAPKYLPKPNSEELKDESSHYSEEWRERALLAERSLQKLLAELKKVTDVGHHMESTISEINSKMSPHQEAPETHMAKGSKPGPL